MEGMAHAPSRSGRPYDVVCILGATAFHGRSRSTAERLAADGPDDLRWAIAGRDPAKLDRVREGLAGLGKAGAAVETIAADVAE